MLIKSFKKSEQILDLREKVKQAEEERLSGAKTLSIDESRKILKKRLYKIKD